MSVFQQSLGPAQPEVLTKLGQSISPGVEEVLSQTGSSYSVAHNKG